MIEFWYELNIDITDFVERSFIGVTNTRDSLVTREESYHINVRFINIQKYFIEAMQGRKIARLSTRIYCRA